MANRMVIERQRQERGTQSCFVVKGLMGPTKQLPICKIDLRGEHQLPENKSVW